MKRLIPFFLLLSTLGFGQVFNGAVSVNGPITYTFPAGQSPTGPSITQTNNPPQATVGVPYTPLFPFTAVAGTSPTLLWSTSVGATPPGLPVDPNTGNMGGTTPTMAGSYSFTIKVQDANLLFATHAYAMQVVNPLNPNAEDNRYCGIGDVALFGTTDGPATLPQTCYNTSIAATTPTNPGTTRIVTDNASMLAAIAAAICGDIIQLQAGIVLDGGGTGVSYTFPPKGCTGTNYIWIRSSGVLDASFPAPGNRVTPCQGGVASLPGRPLYNCPVPANLMAKIVTGNASAGAVFFTGDHYRMTGLEITRIATPNKVVFSLVNLQTVATTNHVIIDRDWIHGINADGVGFPLNASNWTETLKGVYFGQGNHLAVIDSYIGDIYSISGNMGNGNTGADSQCWAGGVGTVTLSGWGQYKFVNNFCEASTENYLFGGSTGPANTPAGCTRGVNCNPDAPTSFEVRRNDFFKPLSWDCCITTANNFFGYPSEKNGGELKYAEQILNEGNTTTNTWVAAQPGYWFSLAAKNQPNQTGGTGSAPAAWIKDATYRYNKGYNISYGFAAYNSSDNGCTNCDSLGTINVSIHDNIGDFLNNLDSANQAPQDSIEVTTTRAPYVNVNMSHNLLLSSVRALMILGASASGLIQNFVVQDNIATCGSALNCVIPIGTGGSCDIGKVGPLNILNACAAGSYTWDHNVVIADPHVGQNWPAGNFFPVNLAAVGFVNANNGNQGDYRLCTGVATPGAACAGASLYHNAAHDGTDIGPNVDLVNLYIAGGADNSNPHFHYVRAGATGANNGTGWTDAFTTWPTMVRGETYYVAGGNYPSHNFNTAASGSTLITVKHATVADHGTSIAWQDAYAVQSHIAFSGWFAGNGGIVGTEISTPFWVIDGGQGQTLFATDATAYGFIVDKPSGASSCSTANQSYFWIADVSNVTYRYIAIDGCGSGFDVQQVGFDNGTGSGRVIEHNFANHLQNSIKLFQATSDTVQYNQLWNQWTSGAHHGESVNNFSTDQITFRYNYLDGCTGTACIACNIGNTIAMNHWSIYGNIFANYSGGNGAIGGVTQVIANTVVYNNTFVNGSTVWFKDGDGDASAVNNVLENNLLYNSNSSIDLASGNIAIRDYNAYFNSGSPSETHVQIGAGNPFVNSGSLNYQLVVNTTAWTPLPSPFNFDMTGSQITSSRGALQFH